jgi:prophage antirepressor-like protein
MEGRKLSNIQIFKNEQFGEVRTTFRDNQPWFCLADLCKVLDIKNVSDCKERLKKDGVVSNEVIDVIGRNQQATFINESNLYKVIFQSRKPEAEKFTDWVTSEVLPSIRKHGMYAKNELLDNPVLLLEIITKLREEQKAKKELERRNNILMHVNKTYTATEIAKELGFSSAAALNKKLNEMKIQFKQNETYVLYSKYSDKGYVDIKQEVLDNGRVIYHRRWTQLGRDFLLNLFNEAC